jgi:hypothetical protein
VIGPSTSLTDVAFAVCTALESVGYTVVLTGGSAATYYAADAYQSDDIDFVITLRGNAGPTALESLGYEQEGDFYRHRGSRFPLEFPPGPLAIGDDVVTSWRTVKRGDEVLYVLSPTDCCRDRLASFLFWNDFRGLEQAVAVFHASRADVDLTVIKDWCSRERHPQKFDLFAARLSPLGSK